MRSQGRWSRAWFLIGALWAHGARADEFDFDRDVAPLLTRHCVRCHQGSDAEGGVELTSQAAMLGATGAVEVLIPGKAEQSLLLEVVTGEKPRMPQSGSPLSPAEQKILRDWIEAGAPWPSGRILAYDPTDWWSLRPLERPEVPAVLDSPSPVRNPIDAFVASQWQRQGLRGSPEADRRTLIRRVTLDLIGLPPAFDDVEAFVADPDPLAYEKLVDRLLNSPRYGERWARHWLDVVHYGDTHGYDKDKLRTNAWPYRDYVIRAFNEDKPYAQFVREQIAGDHFSPHSRDGIEALGFIAAGPFDFVGQIEVGEGTIEKARVRNIDRDDMVATVVNTFVSMTAQCARCHDHKFDPISQEDYYSLQAVFAGVDRADRLYDTDPNTAAMRARLQTEQDTLRQRISDMDSEITSLAGTPLQELDARLTTLRSVSAGERPPEYGYHSAISSEPQNSKWVQIDFGEPIALHRIGLAATHDDFAGIGAGFGFPARFRIDASLSPDFREEVVCVAREEDKDRANPGTVPIWFHADGIRARYVRVTATRLAPRSNDYIFALAELLAVDEKGNNVALNAPVTALDSIEAPVRWRASNLTDGLYPGRDQQASHEEIAKLEQQRMEFVVRTVGRERWDTRERLRDAARDLEEQLSQLPPQSRVYAAATNFEGAGSFQPTRGTLRPIHVLARGAETAPLDPVSPSALQCIPGLPGDFSDGDLQQEVLRRAALADWVVHRDNPLTWRSIVNRVWHYHFGRGIVESLNDFGRMGSEPTHPELLDWLAMEFRDGKQSFKDLHRWMVTSSVYRQSSSHVEENARIDAGNQYLWRMNRRRLEAEAIRDSVLQACGKLQFDMGGPGFYLFGLIDDHSPHYLYDRFDPDDPASHRRAIYRFIVRSVPDPWMTTLDCADASLLTDRRNETLTPLQALAMLNNRFMIRMSQHFASHLEMESADPAVQIAIAYRRALQRAPTAMELETLLELWKSHGLVHVCRSLFNLNEFVFVD